MDTEPTQATSFKLDVLENKNAETDFMRAVLITLRTYPGTRRNTATFIFTDGSMLKLVPAPQGSPVDLCLIDVV
jgi:hypothetical protein